MTIDWTKPIVIAATDWQEELPARVAKRGEYGSYVAVDAPHKIRKESIVWPAGTHWRFGGDGIFCGSLNSAKFRIINKKEEKVPTQKSLDEAAKAAGYSDYNNSEPYFSSDIMQSIQAHAITLDQLHGRVDVSRAERLYRELMATSCFSYEYDFDLKDDDLAAIAILEKALADAANIEPKWIDWHGGKCPVAPDTRVEVKFRDGLPHTNLRAGALTWGKTYGDNNIVAYRVCNC